MYIVQKSEAALTQVNNLFPNGYILWYVSSTDTKDANKED